MLLSPPRGFDMLHPVFYGVLQQFWFFVIRQLRDLDFRFFEITLSNAVVAGLGSLIMPLLQAYKKPLQGFIVFRVVREKKIL